MSVALRPPLPGHRSARWPLLLTLVSLGVLLPGRTSGQPAGSVQEMAARIMWFQGKTPLVPAAVVRLHPGPKVTAMLDERKAALLPGVMDPLRLSADARELRLKAAQEVMRETTSPVLLTMALHRSEAESTRAAAAAVLAALGSRMAVPALAAVLPELTDVRVWQLLAFDLAERLRQEERRPQATPVTRQLLVHCRRILKAAACRPSLDQTISDGLGPIEQALSKGDDIQAAALLRKLDLPWSCPDAHLGALAGLRTGSPTVAMLVMRRMEAALELQGVTGGPPPSPSTVERVVGFVRDVLPLGRRDPVILAHAAGLAPLLGLRGAPGVQDATSERGREALGRVYAGERE